MRFFRTPLQLGLFIAATSVFLATTLAAVTSASQATGFGPSVWDGTYSTAQAQRGSNAYSQHCAECHGAMLDGGEGPALAGDKFWTDWRESTVDALLTFISKNMPFDDGGGLAGSLTPTMYADIVAHILSSNGFPSGNADLSAASAVGVQIIRRDGPGELPASTLARVVGCLEKVGSNFQLVKGTRPVRSDQQTTTTAATVPLGDRTYPLKFLVTPLDRYVGYRMTATGLLLGTGGRDGLNVDTVVPVTQMCQ
ncbi:MAG: cytochrome c [Vicinamibacterales bacterium]